MRKCLKNLAVLLAAALALAAASPNPAKEAAAAYQAAERAARAGDTLKAYFLYAQAARLNPSNALYGQRKLAFQASPSLSGRSFTVDPANETAAARFLAEDLTGTERLEADRAEPPSTLVGTPGTQSLDLRGNGRDVIEQVAGKFGIQVVFDAAYQPLPNVLFRLADVNYQQALRILETSTDSFLVPMSTNVALVARDTTQNRNQYAPSMSVAVPIPERISAQEAQEIVTAVQGVMEIRRISIDPARRVVYFRDTVPKVLAAREMFANLARLRGQIEIDVEMMSTAKTSTLSYGLTLPTSSSIVDFATSVAGFKVTNTAKGSYATFGGGSTLLGLGITDSAIFATLTRASSEGILRAQIAGLDGQTVGLHIGDRYPVIAGTFQALSTDIPVSSTLSPTINYQDLGLVLKVTPVIHADREISLDVDAEFKTLGAGSANGIPVIVSRQYQGKVRLKDGQWAVLAGLVSASDSNTIVGVAGVSDIPGAGRLFSKKTRQMETSDVLLVFKPRIVALPPWERETSTIWTGTQTHPITPF